MFFTSFSLFYYRKSILTAGVFACGMGKRKPPEGAVDSKNKGIKNKMQILCTQISAFKSSSVCPRNMQYWKENRVQNNSSLFSYPSIRQAFRLKEVTAKSEGFRPHKLVHIEAGLCPFITVMAVVADSHRTFPDRNWRSLSRMLKIVYNNYVDLSRSFFPFRKKLCRRQKPRRILVLSGE